MAPPHDGNQLLPFQDLMALEDIDQDTYRSQALPFSPGGFGRAYGGHVFAQAVWAAAQTVGQGFVVHNVTGWFILAGLCNVPFVYSVEHIRDGKSYSTRIVNVTQTKGHGICFTCTCSFKTTERSSIDYQDNVDLPGQYSKVLQSMRESDWPPAPAADLPIYWGHMLRTGLNEQLPGLDARKVDMKDYNIDRAPIDRRQLLFYRVLGSLPASTDPNLHACAHIYASDINSLYTVANNLGVGERTIQLSSIAHTVVLHSQGPDLLMQRQDGERLWFCKEEWATRAAAGRGMYHSRLIGPGGAHIATVSQEGLLRLGKDADAQHAAFAKMMIANGRGPFAPISKL